VASAALFLVLVFNPKSRAFPRILVIMVAAAANIAVLERSYKELPLNLSFTGWGNYFADLRWL